MRINVDDISDSGLRLTFAEGAESFPSLLELSRSGECVFLMPLTIDLRIRRIGQMFEADGRFETRVRLSCSRCLADYETPSCGRLYPVLQPRAAGDGRSVAARGNRARRRGDRPDSFSRRGDRPARRRAGGCVDGRADENPLPTGVQRPLPAVRRRPEPRRLRLREKNHQPEIRRAERLEAGKEVIP